MYDKYVKTRDAYLNKKEEEEWKTNYYGDIPSIIPKTETVESVFVLNARRTNTAKKVVWYVLSGMIFVLLWIIVQKGRHIEKVS